MEKRILATNDRIVNGSIPELDALLNLDISSMPAGMRLYKVRNGANILTGVSKVIISHKSDSSNEVALGMYNAAGELVSSGSSPFTPLGTSSLSKSGASQYLWDNVGDKVLCTVVRVMDSRSINNRSGMIYVGTVAEQSGRIIEGKIHGGGLFYEQVIGANLVSNNSLTVAQMEASALLEARTIPCGEVQDVCICDMEVSPYFAPELGTLRRRVITGTAPSYTFTGAANSIQSPSFTFYGVAGDTTTQIPMAARDGTIKDDIFQIPPSSQITASVNFTIGDNVAVLGTITWVLLAITSTGRIVVVSTVIGDQPTSTDPGREGSSVTMGASLPSNEAAFIGFALMCRASTFTGVFTDIYSTVTFDQVPLSGGTKVIQIQGLDTTVSQQVRVEVTKYMLKPLQSAILAKMSDKRIKPDDLIFCFDNPISLR